MSTLSVCTLVKNEEKVLEKSLKSICNVADEIIVLDTGSTDNTVNIAKRFTNNIHYWPKLDSFSEGFNFLNQQASSDYLIDWDADYVLSNKSLPIIENLKRNNFGGYDSICGDFVTHFTKSHEILEWFRLKLILKNNCYIHERPIHPEIHFTPKAEEKILYKKGFEVFHYNTYNGRSPNYAGYIQTLEGLLQSNPRDDHYLFLIGEEYYFAKQYHKVVESMKNFLNYCDPDNPKKVHAVNYIIQSYLFTHSPHLARDFASDYIDQYLYNSASFTLNIADINSLYNPNKSIELLIYFMEKFDTVTDTDIFNYQRHMVYPSFLLAKLLVNTREKAIAKDFLDQAKKRNKDPEFNHLLELVNTQL